MIVSKQLLVGASMVVGIGLCAGPTLAFDDKSDTDALGAPVAAGELADERAGSFAIGIGFNHAEQTQGDQTVEGDVNVNAGDLTLGNNNNFFAVAVASNQGAFANVLAQNILIVNLTTTSP